MSLSDLIRDVHGSEPMALKPLLDVHMRKLEEYPSNRADGWHPSEFCDSCSRATILNKLLDKEVPFEVGPRLRRIFDYGSALHEWYQNKYLGPMGILWGKWQCSRCREIEWGFMPNDRHDCEAGSFQNTYACRNHCSRDDGRGADAEKIGERGGCLHCGKWGFWEFAEVPVLYQHPKLDKVIVGHSDGLVLLDCWRVLEMKSINDRGFNGLLGPKTGHRNQCEIYGGLIARGRVRAAPKNVEVPTPTGGLVLYMGKDKSVEKEFPFDLDDERYDRLMQYPHEVEAAMEEEELPPRHVECKNRGTGRAKACKVKSHCFGTKDWDELVQIGRKP